MFAKPRYSIFIHKQIKLPLNVNLNPVWLNYFEFRALDGGARGVGEVGDEFIGLAEVFNPEIGDEGESVFLEEGGRVVWVGWWTAEGSGGEVARRGV